MDSKKIIIILLVLMGLAGAFYFYNKDVAPVEPVITQIKEGATVALGQKILNGGVFITPLGVTSDSRCPVDVQCIWAGEISLKVRLEKGVVSKEVILKLQTPVIFEGNKITLTGVAPENNTKKPFVKEDYRFTFLVTPLTIPIPPGGVGAISGTVTTSPTCPVERIPPEPQCAPRAYATSINIKEEGKQTTIKTIQSNNLGVFKTNLPVGSYELDVITANGSILPRCNKITVQVKSSQTTTADISCDTGIR